MKTKAMDAKLVAQLRAMVQRDQSLSHALKRLFQELSLSERGKITLINYAREAFRLTLHEASPIAGWDTTGTGEISDEHLDELVVPAIMSHLEEWTNNDNN
jgi:hypothetical protein